MRLFHAAGDSLIYAEEKVSFKRFNPDRLVETQLGAGHQETLINEAARNNDKNALALRAILTKCRVFHFHDTSLTARIRQYCYIGDSRFLMPDAGNLAAYLYRLFNESPSIYQLIVKNIRLIAPFFHDFDLAPDGLNKNDIILNWRQAESSALFGPHQFSDGTLRAISLISLLLMPKEELPELIVVDEPELGLHPYALNVIAGLFRSASINTQILISTQSSTFLDNFETEDVIVVDRDLKESTFRRLEREELNEWLEEYSLGEVWEKNVIGGGPQ